jgi:hypothetical protein
MPEVNPEDKRAAGLCADCVNAQRITSERGSEFILCRLSFIDARFAKYPRLPVVECAGHQKKKN